MKKIKKFQLKKIGGKPLRKLQNDGKSSKKIESQIQENDLKK